MQQQCVLRAEISLVILGGKVGLILHLKQEFISYSISSLSLGEKLILAIIQTNSFTS